MFGLHCIALHVCMCVCIAGIWNFPGLASHHLEVCVGDLVCVQEELEGEEEWVGENGGSVERESMEVEDTCCDVM